MASTLILQLADRTSAFLRLAGISQNQLCEYLSISKSSLSQFLNGTKGLDPSTVIRLCQTLSLSHAEVVTKFSAPVRSSKVLHLQESTQGRPARMRLDNSGWYPSEDGSGGVDPNAQTGNGIDNTPSADTEGRHVWDQDLIDTLRTARGYHRLAVKSINAYINKAKVNAGIVTPTGVNQKFSRR